MNRSRTMSRYFNSCRKVSVLACLFVLPACSLFAQTGTGSSAGSSMGRRVDSVDQPASLQSEVIMKEYPTLWQQTAAEYRALCYQAFNIASLRLKQIPRHQLRQGRLAIITDLDETILDNSYSEAQMIRDNRTFNKADWQKWLDRSAATGVPGAVAFLQEAAAEGIHIFYVSNRDTASIATTLINLQKLHLPDADTSHMLFATDNTGSKESRRMIVAGKYRVVMLLGDNLGDFIKVFDGKPVAERFTETDRARQDWGRKFIVLPNSTYGEWENALLDHRHGLSPSERQALLQAKLNGF